MNAKWVSYVADELASVLKPRGIHTPLTRASLSLLSQCLCQRHRRAQRKFRRLTYPAKPTRRCFAQLLKPLLICSSCVLPSTFHYTLHFFGESSLLRKWFIENELTAPAEQAHTAAVPTEKSEPRFSEGSLLRNEPQYPMMWYALHIFSFAKKVGFILGLLNQRTAPQSWVAI